MCSDKVWAMRLGKNRVGLLPSSSARCHAPPSIAETGWDFLATTPKMLPVLLRGNPPRGEICKALHNLGTGTFC